MKTAPHFALPALFAAIAAPGLALSPAQSFGPVDGLASSAELVSEASFADLDGDGDLDVVASSLDGDLHWYENGGDGGFIAAHRLSHGAAFAQSHTVTDLEGDGDADILVPVYPQRTVLWYVNDGAGYFSGPLTVTTGATGVSQVAVADVDGDGDKDCLFDVQSPTGERSLRWVPYDGAGGFGPSQLRSSSITQAVVSVDLEADGDDDLVGTGDGFGALVNLGAGAWATQVLSVESAVAFDAADLDGDGDVDLVATFPPSAGSPAGSLQIFENTGPLTWASSLTVPTQLTPEPGEVHVVDLDGDGLMDLVVESLTDETLNLHLGLGGFTYAPAIDIAAASALQSVDSADLGQDGDADLLLADWEGTGLEDVTLLENPGMLPLSARRSVAIQAHTAAVPFLCDLDGDGDDDAVWGGSLGQVVLHEGLGDGRFGAPRVLREVIPGAFPQPMGLFRAADLDQDGHTDLVSLTDGVGTGRLEWYRGDGQLGFDPPTLFNGFAGRRTNSLAVMDVDGDGAVDLLHSNVNDSELHWRRSLGAGLFAAPVELDASIPRTVDLEVSDLDGDGDLDLVLFTWIGDRVGWVEFTGPGSFEPFAPIEELDAPSIPQDLIWNNIVCGDLNGDGRDDIVSIRPSVVLLSTGAGTYAPAVSFSSEIGHQFVQLGDVNADGHLDIVASGSVAHDVFLGSGDGTFEAGVALPAEPSANSNPRVALGDVDGDGDSDLLTITDRVGVRENYARLGQDVCGAGVPNSTGSGASLSLHGTPEILRNDLVLHSAGLPSGSFGLFLVSASTGFVANPAGSQGNLCLGGAIGRYVGPGQVQSADMAGEFELPVDWMSLPSPGGAVSAQPGDTWTFQAWYRDANPQVTSNFSSGRSIVTRP